MQPGRHNRNRPLVETDRVHGDDAGSGVPTDASSGVAGRAAPAAKALFLCLVSARAARAEVRISAGLLFPVFLFLAVASIARSQPRPNIILVVADDLGPAELGAYGQRTLSTPRLDALAERSVRFVQAYSTSPVCAPSRCAILTGRHAGRCAVTENDEPNQPLASRDPTVAELLASVGYRAGVVGKWALGGETREGTPWNVQSAPWRVGFVDVFAVLDQALAQNHYPPWLWVASREEPPTRRILTENERGARGLYAPDIFASRAVELVERAPEPFFLYVPFTLPHREFVAPPGEELRADFSPPDAAYAAMVARLDAHVGALLDAIERRGIAERTWLVFTSDNGPNAVDGHGIEIFDSTGGLRGRKRDLYEGGIRVPLLVRGPGLSPRVLDEPVALYDLLPTLTQLARAPTPPEVDGRSLVELFEGNRSARPNGEPLYFACRERRGGAEPPTSEAVRLGRWKWIRLRDREELYDLEADPAERADLSAREPALVERLRGLAQKASRPRAPWRAPVLEVRVEGRRPLPPERQRARAARESSRVASNEDPVLEASRPPSATPVLVLDPDDVEDGDRTWPQRLLDPPVVATLVNVEVIRGGHGTIRFDARRASHVVVPSHPALAVFGGSFTLRARVSLGSLAAGPFASERQWLLFAKPAGASDEFIVFGLLVQGGDIACADAPSTCSGREVVVVFGDPRLSPARPIVVTSGKRIEDSLPHEIVVRVDRARAEVAVALDGEEETIPFVFGEGITSEVPLFVGARHDAEGRIGEAFSGVLHRLALAEGLATAAEMRSIAQRGAPRHIALDLGAIPEGATHRLVIELASAPIEGAHWMETDVVLDEGVRATLEGPAQAILFAGEQREVFAILDTSRVGRYRADLTIRARRGRTGAHVEGAPVRVHVRAEIVSRAGERTQSTDDAVFRALGILLVASALVAVLAVARRARQRIQ